MDRVQLLLYRNGWPWRVYHRLGRSAELRVTEHHVELATARSGTPALTIGFASDFHAGPTTSPELLRRACHRLRELSPDLLLLGGDFVSLDVRQVDWLAPLLGEVPAPLGRYAVLGNHDHWNGASHISQALRAAGVEVLMNENRRLPAPFQDYWVCGLDDYLSGTPDAVTAMAGAEGTRIVLMHAPANLLDLKGIRFELALCGHTHGGQIALRGGFPLGPASGPLSRVYSRGRFPLKPGGTLLVSVGLGCSTVPLRLNTPPELLVCRVHPAQA